MYRVVNLLAVAFVQLLRLSTGNLTGCEKPVSFHEAMNCCQLIGGSSFTPYTALSRKDQMGIIRNLRERNIESAWINLKRNTFKEWRWADKSVSGINTVVKPPAECGVVNLNTRHLEVTACVKKMTGILCQKKDCASCASLGPESSSCFYVENNCFIFSCGAENWYSARSYCHRKGWELAVLTDESVIREFRAKDWFGDDAVCKTAWIGLHKVDWLPVGSKEYPEEVFWAEMEPSNNGSCTIITKLNEEFYWKSCPCDFAASCYM